MKPIESSRPVISDEARQRIIAMVLELALLQVKYGVSICGYDVGSKIALRDRLRTDQWVGPESGAVYGHYDAFVSDTSKTDHVGLCAERKYFEPCICLAIEPGIQLENVTFEDFDGWGK